MRFLLLPRLGMTTAIFLAFPPSVVDEIQREGRVEFKHYKENWPTRYNKKWIPVAPSAQEALRSWEESLAFEPGNVDVLEIKYPTDQWTMWRDSGIVVPNPGYRRKGASKTDREGHWLYNRLVCTDENDPVLPIDGYAKSFLHHYNLKDETPPAKRARED